MRPSGAFFFSFSGIDHGHLPSLYLSSTILPPLVISSRIPLTLPSLTRLSPYFLHLLPDSKFPPPLEFHQHPTSSLFLTLLTRLVPKPRARLHDHPTLFFLPCPVSGSFSPPPFRTATIVPYFISLFPNFEELAFPSNYAGYQSTNISPK